MKISDFLKVGIEIKRDADFAYIAKAGDNPPGSFLTYVEKEKFIDQAINNSKVSCIITTSELAGLIPETKGVAVSNNPKYAMLQICDQMKRLSLPTVIGQNCEISSTAEISEYGVVIGNNVKIEGNVVIYSGVVIKDNCIIKKNSILGCDEYEQCKAPDGKFRCFSHYGKVIIEKDCTIMHNCVIDKALFDWDCTHIGENCFIGNNCMIAHGSKLDSSVCLSPSVTLCGNVNIGSNSKVGPGAVLSNRIVVGKGVDIKIGSVVTTNLCDGAVVSGNFAIEHQKTIRNVKKLANED